MHHRLLRLLAPLAAMLALLPGCTGPAGEESAPPPATVPAAPAPGAAAEPAAAPSPAARGIGENTRKIMLETLAREREGQRQAWLAITPGDPETAALKDDIAALFEEAGWTVHTRTLTGIRLKPGVVLLLADETPPSYTDAVVEAFEASGLGVKTATGYRPYYEEMKQQEPDWAGIPMTAEQDFALVIGPRPAE